MKTTPEHDERIAKMTFASVYPHYVTKIEKKGRTKEELHQVIGKLLRKEIDQISKMLPDELGGEIKDFLRIHGAGIKESPTGKKILVEEIGGRKSYYTEEQKLYQ